MKLKTYICILRGINVSGQKLIKMEKLRSSLSELGFCKVTTYIQSGNIVFQFKEEASTLPGKMIGEKIQEDFGYDVPVLLLSINKLRNIVANNRFAGDPSKDIKYLHVTFLAQPPEQFDKEEIITRKAETEEIIFSDDAVYLFCPGGYGKTKLNNNFIESRLKVSATTRNWRTTLKLLDLAEGLER
ncbi:DUF1697 domain-containing protein [Maribellus mangrovi]|uniref:DUF1697 domain-containing protein n=1 Tax=Maribellus mangrovi TaxID=3133146 RepID=UPI0030EC4BF4